MADTIVNKSGVCKLCGIELTLADPKRMTPDGQIMICPTHPGCQVKTLRFQLARLKAALVYCEGDRS